VHQKRATAVLLVAVTALDALQPVGLDDLSLIRRMERLTALFNKSKEVCCGMILLVDVYGLPRSVVALC
jgi:hypothetical protein